MSLIDKKLCENICYELGFHNFSLRKAFTNMEKIKEIYIECINNKSNNKKILVLEKQTIKDNLKYIIKNTYPISYTIIETIEDWIIIIPITWSKYILVEPVKSNINIFIYEELYNCIII